MFRYLAEITYDDDQVGEALGLIDEHGLTDETLVIVVSEQGNSMPFAKWTCYDSGLQSAFIARWPGKIEPGSENPAMIEYIDILPTFIEAAGGTPDPAIQGRSLLPVFAGQTTHKEYVYGEMTTRGIHNGSDHFGIRSVRSEQFKYIWNFTPGIEFRNACVKSPEFQSWVALAETDDTRATELVDRYLHRPEIELYDVQQDPLELNNLADNPQHDDIKRQLRSELDRWMTACDDNGQQTELEANEHAAVKRKASPNPKRKSNRRRAKANPPQPTP